MLAPGAYSLTFHHPFELVLRLIPTEYVNLHDEYMTSLDKQPYDGMTRSCALSTLVDEAENVTKYSLDVRRYVLVQSREFGADVLLASQMPPFRTPETDYSKPPFAQWCTRTRTSDRRIYSPSDQQDPTLDRARS